MNLVEAAAACLEDLISNRLEQEFSEILGKILDSAKSDDLLHALKIAKEKNSDSPIFRLINNELKKRKIAEDGEGVTSTAGVAMPSFPMPGANPLRRKSFEVEDSVYENVALLKLDSAYVEIVEALNKGETVILKNRKSGLKKAVRRKHSA
jgi:hypothetical protein